jgi:hypothetical protein
MSTVCEPEGTAERRLRKTAIKHGNVVYVKHTQIMKNLFCRLQLPTYAGSSLADFSALKIEAMGYSITTVNTRSTRRHIPEDGILLGHRRENIKSYTLKFVFIFLQAVEIIFI